MSESHTDLTIVLVLYNSKEVVETCLAPFSPEQKIIAVDNACTDGSAELVLTLHPQATIIRNEENLGYGPAGNRCGRPAIY